MRQLDIGDTCEGTFTTFFKNQLKTGLNIQGKLYRTMVGTKHIGMNLGIHQLIVQRSGGNKVVDTPACILFTRFEAIRPPGVDFLLIRIKVAESVCKARIQYNRP